MNLRSQKGINMITLSVAVIILVIITSILVYNAKDGTKIKSLNNLYNDIEQLNNKVSSYYLKHGDIPKGDEYTDVAFIDGLDDTQKNPNNEGKYYVINLNALEGVSLNYGKKFGNQDAEANDIYIINEVSHTIYYPRGIEVEGKKYYTEPDEWTEVNLSAIPIYTAEQLKEIAQLGTSGETSKNVTIEQTGNTYNFTLDGIYSLQNEIDLSSICYRVDGTPNNDVSWIPIGTQSSPFIGIFYGNGYKISNLYINTNDDSCGLFGVISQSGVINGVNVNGNIKSTGINVGGLAGRVINNNCSISNCINNVEIEQNNNSANACYAGGIIGRNNGTIMNCKNNVTISSNFSNTSGDRNSLGGITGYNLGEIMNCTNTGSINGNSSNTYCQAGGIVGRNEKNIFSSNNYGKIYADSTSTPLIGGIAGLSAYSNSLIKNCYNNGNVNAIKSTAWQGGIVGDLFQGASCEKCYSIGINTISNEKINGYAIARVADSTNTGTITNCYGLDLNYSFISQIDSSEKIIDSELKSSSNMKDSQSFVDLLNGDQEDAPWVMDTIGDNDGYPIFKWQTEK